MACWVLVYFPDQGSNPGPHQWEHSSPNHWTARKFPQSHFVRPLKTFLHSLLVASVADGKSGVDEILIPLYILALCPWKCCFTFRISERLVKCIQVWALFPFIMNVCKWANSLYLLFQRIFFSCFYFPSLISFHYFCFFLMELRLDDHGQIPLLSLTCKFYSYFRLLSFLFCTMGDFCGVHSFIYICFGF